MLKGVLLDVDGTLVLSNDAHASSWVEAFARFGYKVKFDQVRPLIGMGGDKLIPILVPSLSSESGDGKAVSDLRSGIFQEKYAPKLQPAPGSRDFVNKLLKDVYRLIVASSAQSHELGALLKSAQVDDLLDKATTSSDAEQSKPDPDIIHAALGKLKLMPNEVIMVGDTPYDIEAAGRAGVQMVVVRCGGWSDHDLHGAVGIYDDPADILKNYNSSPFAGL